MKKNVYNDFSENNETIKYVNNKEFIKTEEDLPKGFRELETMKEEAYFELLEKAYEESKRYQLNLTYVNDIFDKVKKGITLQEQEQKYFDMWIRDAQQENSKRR